MWQNSKLKLWQNSKTQIATKLENSNCDKTKKFKLWQNFKKNSNIDKTKKNQTVTKLKKKTDLWQNSRTQTVIELKKKLWQNLKDQIVTKLKNSNCAKLKKQNCDNSKTQIVIVIKITVVTEVVIMTSFSKKHLNTLTTDYSQSSFWQFLRCFLAAPSSSRHLVVGRPVCWKTFVKKWP